MVRLIHQQQRNSSGQQSWKCFIEMCDLCAEDVFEKTTAWKLVFETSQQPIEKKKKSLMDLTSSITRSLV